MLGHRLIAAWLRLVAGLLALAGVLALTACGGGSGAPNNPFAPGPATPPALSVLPPVATVYSKTPSTLTISGGVAPFFAFSSNSAVLPVAQAVSGDTVLLVANDVADNAVVTITIRDSIGQEATALITVAPAPLLPNLVTITPNNDCPGSPQDLGGALCSGGTGTAAVRLTAPGGGGLANRQVRFDVVQGDFAIQSSNPATPLVSTLTVVSDANGNAVVGIAVPVAAVTQIAVIRATDLTTGNQVSGQFTITQVTDGSAVLSVIPTGTTTITGPLQGVCSSGARVTYFIFGGTPPYQVRATFPNAVALAGVPVLTNGGSFTAITNGTCFTAMQFAITDATGRTIPGGSSPLLTNEPGTTAPTPPTPPATLQIAPGTVSSVCPAGSTFRFLVVGGTVPYSPAVSPMPPATIGANIPPDPMGTDPGCNRANGCFVVAISASYVGDVVLAVSDSGAQAVTATITCQ